MRVEAVALGDLPSDLVAVGVPFHQDGDALRPAIDTAALPSAVPFPATVDAAWCARHGCTGKVGQTVVVHSAGATGGSGADVVLVGLGERTSLSGDAGLESLRRAAAAFVRSVGEGPTAALVFPVAPDGSALTSIAAASSLAEGAVLASYRYSDFRTGDRPEGLGTLLIAAPAGQLDAVAAGSRRGARLAESVGVARDLVNEPPSSLTPTSFADFFLRRFADVPELAVEVWEEDRITEERLGALLGVARGSSQPPRFVTVEYTPSDPIEIDGRIPHLALVGKGITFDSGGLSLKTATGMETMKTDMGGAAAVLASVDAAAALGARIRITAFAPLTENMPGGSAIKPGDVLTTRLGKTIEVLNTDAEGRLVLSDGLALAVEADPDAIIDLATLTGAAVVALGKDIAAVMGNDDRLLDEVRAAGGRAGEQSWPLPMPAEYRSHIDSEVADMRNTGRPGQAGSISAAMVLREFVGEVPWAHLDIAGTGRTEDSGRYFTKGGTGYGVRTLVALVTSEEFARTLVGLRAD